LEPHTGLATARLDLFFDGEDLRVIEVNATIPAMQAYSDMVNEAYVASMGVSVRDEDKGSNTMDLLQSLLAHYAASGGSESCPRIGIVARKGDSQLAELRWFKMKWERAGYECIIGSPEDVAIAQSRLTLSGVPIDVTYRHIFASRLAAHSAFAEACARSQTFRVFNPVSAHLEAKAVLAEASRIAGDDAVSRSVGLSEIERAAIRRRVPWTRVIAEGPGSTPDGEACFDLLGWVKTHQSDVVIKGNLGYGGHAVVVGDQFSGKDLQGREVSWAGFVDGCASDQIGLWLVQAKVNGRQIDNSFVRGGQVVKERTYVDCSIFANLGVDFLPSGGASRFSTNNVVNIGQGGGVMPLLFESQAKRLFGKT
jgi:hypothetical protein